MPQQRRHFFKRAKSSEEYLAEEAMRFKEAAESLPQGSTARELLYGEPSRPKPRRT